MLNGSCHRALWRPGPHEDCDMQRLLIKGINCALLIIVLVGVPAVTSANLGSLQVSSTPIRRMLMLWGLSLATGGNAVAAAIGLKDAKDRRLCRDWAIAFAGLLGVEYAFFYGYLDFGWLKRALLWLKARLNL
jgi:hypothetical protein